MWILTPLEAHLLLALSSGEHLLVSSSNPPSSDSIYSAIEALSFHPNVERSVHIASIPSHPADTDESTLLSSFFLQSDGDKSNHLPQVLVIPHLDEFKKSAHLLLLDVLRTKRFTLYDQTYNLRNGFVLVGLVADFSKVSRHLVGLFPCDIFRMSNP